MTFEVILNSFNECLHVDIFENFKKDWPLNKKYIAEKDDVDILR